MKKSILYKMLLLSLSLCLGIVYYFLIQVSVVEVKHSSSRSNTFSFVVSSHIEQNVKLHVAAEKTKLRVIECKGIKILFPEKKQQWFEGMGEQVDFLLDKGSTYCTVYVDSFGKEYTPAVKQKITFLDYSILFLLIGIPLFQLLFSAFMWGLNLVKSKTSAINVPLEGYHDHGVKLTWLLCIIFFAGVVIRVLYFEKFGIMTFQHDWHGHIEFIKYIAQNWTLPLPSKGLEYPQQPLYYLLTGGLYALFTHFGLNASEALHALGYFSLLCSIFFLYYTYQFMTLMTQSVWVRTVAMAFVSFTPSIVYLSARINNDSLVMGLSAYALYHIVKSYQSDFRVSFYKALAGVSLLFLTKISSAPMEVLLFSLLGLTYVRSAQREIKQKLFVFGVVGVFLLGFTLLRVYLPIEHTFHMVNSSAHYPNQGLPSLGLDYFTTFNFSSLFNAGYSYVFGEDAIRHSFLTYQYGTMFFGEFNHSAFLENKAWLHMVMQGTLLLGLVYPLGLILFMAYLYRAPLLHTLLFGIIILNLLLILKFIVAYPVVCNTDFRYLVPTFMLLAFVFAQGLGTVTHLKWIKKILSILLSLLSLTEILYFIAILG